MSKKKQEKKMEEPIDKGIGYPYNIIPKGYPNKISNKKINETIEKILQDLRSNAGVKDKVLQDTSLTNLGSQELNNRINRRNWLIAVGIAFLSLLMTILS